MKFTYKKYPKETGLAGVASAGKEYYDIKKGNEYQKLHRYILEKHLGRKLASNEIVHHIDGNGLNNKLSNLKIMTHAQHQRLHRCFENLKGGKLC
jgi:hypothetical protein